MKDEIKEILDSIKNAIIYSDNIDTANVDIGIEKYMLKKLLDCITNLQDTLKDREEYCYGLETELTNLQEENDRLKDELKRLHNLLNSQAYQDLDKYKSRNEKAINEVIRVLQIILEQPSKDKLDDLWIINRLEGIQTLLQGEYKDE